MRNSFGGSNLGSCSRRFTSTNTAVLGLLNTTISCQADEQEEQNKIFTKQLEHTIKKEGTSKNPFKNLHDSSIQMILFASALDKDKVPVEPVDSCKRIITSKRNSWLEQSDTRSNHSPYSFAKVEPIQAAEQKTRHLTIQLILTQGQGMLVKEIKAWNKQEVHPPMNFHEL